MSCSNSSTKALEWKLGTVIRQSAFVLDGHAEDLLESLMDGIRQEFGGGDLFIDRIDREKRADAVRRDFNGRNRAEVCRRHGISRATFYRIIGNR